MFMHVPRTKINFVVQIKSLRKHYSFVIITKTQQAKKKKYFNEIMWVVPTS